LNSKPTNPNQSHLEEIMRKILILLALLLAPAITFAQNSDQHFNGTLTATCASATAACPTVGGDVEVSVVGYGEASVTVSGTFTGSSVNFETSDDPNLANWYSDTCTRTDNPIQEIGEALPNSTNRAWDCGVAGSLKFRIRQSAYTSGTVNVGITITAASIEPAPTVAVTGAGYTPITTNASTQIKTGTGYLQSLVVSSPGSAWTVQIFDNTSCIAPAIFGKSAAIAIPAAGTVIPFNLTFNTGLCVITAGTTPGELLITWR
jgi:hypothetical protein